MPGRASNLFWTITIRGWNTRVHPYDLKHSFKTNYYYELPYGENKRWNGNRFTEAVLGGWAVSGIWGYSSGSPYSILSGYGTLNRVARSTSTNTASV